MARIPTSEPAIAVLYEHPGWFDRLFAELDRRGTPYRRLLATEHVFDPADLAPPAALTLNRLSASAHTRDHGDTILYGLEYLGHLEQIGARVINGAAAFALEISKARQLSLLAALGLPFPATRVIHRAAQAPAAADALGYPVIVKPETGGRGAGVVRFDTAAGLRAAVAAGTIDLGPTGVALVQRYVAARDGHITRVETMGGRYLYAIDVHLSGSSFDLCPADLCRIDGGTAVGEVCVSEVAGAPAAAAPFATGAQPPPAIVAEVERIVAAAGLEVGGVEYVVDAEGRHYFYDINALSNFVADAPNVIGFDPWPRFVDWLEARARDAGARLPANVA